ncbi:MAG: V-type ATP synthase subunit D [Actinobacteria bacterium]|nr:V-type ATP synthase subunit D [Actinomycetota bacterium]MCG2796385.1 V-type ATP synthase subunit D [Actinomycetes bacterium]MBU4240110.1 V-type ATP synthase subunit D [Actinomycetota bacterium]MBU4302218.1 V-type ATP synthase subunit D [Actinomycetota bacterium]MBU4386130.1 V-type ATP synthase subunit D [Actinomycetota bacterium]
MERVKPTRSELLFRRQQIKLAVQGMDLLKKKRDALLREFLPIIDETMRLSLQLERSTADAQEALAMARAVDGRSVLQSVSFATKGEVQVDISGTHVMGVPIPVIRKAETTRKTELERGYSVTGVSSRIGQTASKFEEIIDTMIESADIETRLRRLGEELEKTNRRVNALENVVIPELEAQVKFIFSSLDERAREDHFRLKKVKKKILERKKKT